MRLDSSPLRGILSAAGGAALDLLFPRGCCACDGALDPSRPSGPGAPGGLAAAFCPDCAAGVVPLDAERCCHRCAAPLPERGGCADCRRLRPRFAAARSVFEYGAGGGPLAEALQRLKWRDRDDVAGPLGALLGPALAARAGAVDLVVPVPLHRERLVRRGYNQAGLLAVAARRAAARPVPLRHGLLLRRGAAAPARALGWRARRERAAGAFHVDGRLRGERVLLIDDVMTTGATAGGCADALLLSGAGRVEVLTLSRVVS